MEILTLLHISFIAQGIFFVTNTSSMQGELSLDYLLDMALIRELPYDFVSGMPLIKKFSHDYLLGLSLITEFPCDYVLGMTLIKKCPYDYLHRELSHGNINFVSKTKHFIF